MDADTCKRLIELNQQFYQTFAIHFSATRQRIQPGVRRLVETLKAGCTLLDLGCGNGEFWQALQKDGRCQRYVGLDFSPPLLELAAGRPDNRAEFLQADLSSPDWASALPAGAFDFITAFAVLHHLPGLDLRRQTLQQVHRLLAPGGRFFHSEWQFLNSPRLRARIQPWQTIGMQPNQVDAGDFLLDWRHGGSGLRYAHHFDMAELEELAQQSGFMIRETFLSDGQGGNLGLYQVWEALAK